MKDAPAAMQNLPATSLSKNNLWLESLPELPALQLKATLAPSPDMRLIRLDAISEEKHQAYRQALANVYATLGPEQNVRFLYLLDSGPKGVSLYFGVIAGNHGADVHESIKNLRGALEGQLPGIQFGEEVTAQARQALIEPWNTWSNQGVMLGVPTLPTEEGAGDEQNFQGIDRLVRALQSGSRLAPKGDGRWQMVVIGQPLTRQQIRQQLDEAFRLSSEVATFVRTSVQASGNTSRQESLSTGISRSEGTNKSESYTRGKSEGGTESKNHSTSGNSGTSESKTHGTSESKSKTTGNSQTDTTSVNYSHSDSQGSTFGFTQEITNKRAQHLLDHLDKQLIPRLQKGLTKGMFQCAVYFAAANNSTYQRLKNNLRATFQGAEATMSPLEVFDLPEKHLGQCLHLPVTDAKQNDGMLFHSLYLGYVGRSGGMNIGSLLTTDELATIACLPQRELHGIRRLKTVDFIVDLPDVDGDDAIDLGAIIDRGRRYPNNRVFLARRDLNKHVFVTGVTGAGKTTTCLNLLLESRQPFIVIEPAKTEYRELARRSELAIDFYRPNGDDYHSLRINPFALVRKGQRIKSHAGFIKNVLTNVFPMEASMPMMVEAAILAAYEDKGWDIDENEFLPGGDPFDPITQAWPTLSDMIRQLDRLIPTYGLGREFEEKYRGSLVSRLRSLTDGALGRVLDVPQSLDFHAMLTRHVVIELEEIQGGEEKALLMALLLGAINEGMRAHHARDPDFRQITLIEEAHRLLSRPEPGDKAGALAAEAFADMLAEVRKYGAGLIIADQIPAKLIPDVIKNTHTKIVHRLLAEEDRRAMGEAMMMSEKQRNFLPNLATGEAIVFCGGWHGPAHAAIRSDLAQTDNRNDLDLTGCSIQQLWRERHRYYPQFCRLGWMSVQASDAERLARFVRETRKAQNQLLHVIAPDDRQQPYAEGAFNNLKAWLAYWDNEAVDAQASFETFLKSTPEPWPERLLAAAWFALLLDANPRPHIKEKDAPTLKLRNN
ncbi:MAG: hypothetical protein K6346_01655, partial [Halothiobacillaceae bacterium]